MYTQHHIVQIVWTPPDALFEFQAYDYVFMNDIKIYYSYDATLNCQYQNTVAHLNPLITDTSAIYLCRNVIGLMTNLGQV